jgi:hypothetical protein
MRIDVEGAARAAPFGDRRAVERHRFSAVADNVPDVLCQIPPPGPVKPFRMPIDLAL